MNTINPPKDLFVVVADKNMEAALNGILSRPESLRIRRIEFEVRRHGNDPRAYGTSHEFLRDFRSLASYALVVFDRHGCGSLSSRDDLESEVETLLRINGWESRSAAIVIDPELENWFWSDSPHVEAGLGWPSGQLRAWLTNQGLWPVGATKPNNPKGAVEQALRQIRKPRTSDIYLRIAERVSLERCTDQAFVKLKTVLRQWFPA